MTHIDDFIDLPGGNRYARAMLAVFRLPAVEMLLIREELLGTRRLFCTWQGKRYRVTGASRLGDVWLSANPARVDGYNHRVDVSECSEWGPKR